MSDIEAEIEFGKILLKQYAGKWVAIRGREVIASAVDGAGLYAKLVDEKEPYRSFRVDGDNEAAYDGMMCQDCHRPFSEVIDFLVADVIWNYVMARQKSTTLTIRKGLFDERLQPRSEGVVGVVCLACFDKRARALNIEYRQYLVVFGVDAWMARSYEDGVPT